MGCRRARSAARPTSRVHPLLGVFAAHMFITYEIAEIIGGLMMLKAGVSETPVLDSLHAHYMEKFTNVLDVFMCRLGQK